MEFGNRDSDLNRVVALLRAHEANLQETADQFPATPEQYRGLPLGERLDVACNMMKQYANIGRRPPVTTSSGESPFKSDCATAKLSSEEDPNVEITAIVGYDQTGRWSYAHKDELREKRHKALVIWAKATDKQKDISTGYSRIAKMNFGTHDYIRFGSGGTVKFEDPEASPIIEIVDSASCSLILDVLARDRGLGRAAVTQS